MAITKHRYSAFHAPPPPQYNNIILNVTTYKLRTYDASAPHQNLPFVRAQNVGWHYGTLCPARYSWWHGNRSRLRPVTGDRNVPATAPYRCRTRPTA